MWLPRFSTVPHPASALDLGNAAVVLSHQAGGRLNSRERSTSRDPNGSPSDPETGKRSRGKRERRRQSRQSAERDDGELADKVTRGDPLRSIAEHYDHKSEKIAQETLRDRQQSDLIALRDFHNWIKRELILRHTRSVCSAV